MKILIAIPAYNEEAIIAGNIAALDNFLIGIKLEDEYLIVVADNNSTDRTGELVKQLAANNPRIEYLHVPTKGKGIALRTAWQKYTDNFDIFSFMDADLATGMAAFNPKIQAIKSGADMAIGSRYLSESKLNRSIVRKMFSAGYRFFLKILLGTKIKDFPCGFKALNKKTLLAVLPQVQNDQWFFDSELVYLASRQGFNIVEIPVEWHEPRSGENKSRVSLYKQTMEYLKELLRLRFRK